MRYYFYIVSGIFAALIGWIASQVLLIGAGEKIGEGILPLPREFLPEFVLLPLVAASLSVAMVVIEIFLSNPTRYRANRRVLPPYLLGGLVMGIVAGLIAAVLAWVLYEKSDFPSPVVRVATWGVVGWLVGLSEGFSWRFRSIEGSTSKGTRRILNVMACGCAAGLVAAGLVEIVRRGIELRGYEDPFGFLLLGLCFGLLLSFATRPTYQVALRAGEGFEAVAPSKYSINSDRDRDRYRPRLNKSKNSALRFVTDDDDEERKTDEDDEERKTIEEGLSIQLSWKTKDPIYIGSDPNADIIIPNLPPRSASLKFASGNFELKCLREKAVQVHRVQLSKGKKVTLRHNHILTFYHESNPKKYYRFVFYDRFLDPQA